MRATKTRHGSVPPVIAAVTLIVTLASSPGTRANAVGGAAPAGVNPGATLDVLTDVSAVSASDVWAVGYFQDDPTPLHQKTLILHWNGARWSRIPSPNPSPVLNELTGVFAVGADDVWAAGTSLQQVGVGSVNRTLTEHWNGKKWSVVPSPNVGRLDSSLAGIGGDGSATHLWAVGSWEDDTTFAQHTLTLEWTGLRWRLQPSPDPSGEDDRLAAVRVVSKQDVWAVGASDLDTLVLHRTGATWKRAKSPDPCDSNALAATAGISPSNAWAAGSCDTAGVRQTLVIHWNGSRWTRVDSPSPGAKFNSLAGVAALAGNNAWAVGSATDVPVGGDRTLALHWNGRRWRTVPTPSPDALDVLTGVAAVATDDVWAVGYTGDGTGVFRTLLLHWNGTRWMG